MGRPLKSSRKPIDSIPTWLDCCRKRGDRNSSPLSALEEFIYVYEPMQDEERSYDWRKRLAKLVKELVGDEIERIRFEQVLKDLERAHQ